MKLIEKIKIKTKDNFIFSHFFAETCNEWGRTSFRERKCNFSLDFQAFGSSVLVGPRSKVDIRYKGYVWTPILWSFDNSKR